MKGGIKINDFQRLQKYINAALKRCECELDPDRRDEIEEFLWEKFWTCGKPIPTKVVIKGKTIKDPAVRWALREKLKDIHFQNHTISSIQNDDREEVDIFEYVGKREERYAEIEQWRDICAVVGAEPASAMLLGLYDTKKKEQTKEQEEWKQAVLF